MVEVARELDWLIDESYVPSSIERKKAVLMYFFVGIIAALSKESVSFYEFFHLKQSMWWWMIFFMGMMVGIIFVFIPWFWIIPVMFFLCFLVVRVLFVKQAWEWEYMIDDDKVMLPFFAGMWWWVVSIFELDIVSPEEDDMIEE